MLVSLFWEFVVPLQYDWRPFSYSEIFFSLPKSCFSRNIKHKIQFDNERDDFPYYYRNINLRCEFLQDVIMTYVHLAQKCERKDYEKDEGIFLYYDVDMVITWIRIPHIEKSTWSKLDFLI